MIAALWLARRESTVVNVTPEETVRNYYRESYELLKQYVDILADRGISWGLLGPREAERLWDRHILNCLSLADVIPEGLAVVDVGSGAGLPGIPLSIVRSDLDVTLLEPLKRRYEFLVRAVDELGLAPRVNVVRGRAEECKEVFEAVICRAVAPLQKLLGWCAPLFRSRGSLYALKGSSAPEEVTAAQPFLDRLDLVAEVRSVRAAPEAEATSVIVVSSR